MNIPVTEIHDIFLTHEHTDHLLGMIWMIRVIGQAIQKGKYEGNFEDRSTNIGIPVIDKFINNFN